VASDWLAQSQRGVILARSRRRHCSHLILKIENVVQHPVEVVSPNVRGANRVNELACDAYPVASLSHATFENVLHTKVTSHLFNVDGPTPVSKTRIACYHEQPRQPRQRCGNFLDHPIGEIFLLWIAAHILERQYC